MGVTAQERAALTVVGGVALAAVVVLAWQQRRAPLLIETAQLPAQAAGWDDALASARQVDVNTAEVTQLERLPGVGPALARRIVAYRTVHGPFRSLEELSGVEGIGAKTVEALADYAVVK
ncbi:MAG: helix-hairpin-helix domain-containing protein [Candidatus Omnitrophota bacterium]|nr:helix-hairpin-helix domain-containing protein [Candidatus Omnitrophota bacterium]